MTSYYVLTSEVSSMIFWKRKRAALDAKREEQIQRIRLDTQKQMKAATASLKRAQDEIDRLVGDDVAQNIFYATGGDRRHRNV